MLQLHAVTAGIALVVVQLCVALVMAGVFFALPKERCTRLWALSGAGIAAGLLLVVLNAGAPRPGILIAGNGLVTLGFVLQWAGLRDFYRRSVGWTGWLVALTFMAVFIALVTRGAPLAERVLAASVTLMILGLLCLRELMAGQAQRQSFAGMLAIGAITLLIVAYGLRAALAVLHGAGSAAAPDAPASVVLLYFIPLAGSLVFSCGLLLIYFERIIHDKHQLATHDELTGLLNRRAIVAAGERELTAAERSGAGLAVALIDLDHFKSINDRLGHEAGDRVLIEAGRVLQQACRKVDRVGRYGGEEFCFVLPGVDAASAPVVAGRIVEAVRARDFPDGLRVTASLGMALLEPDGRATRWSELVGQADKALYRAKLAGRDRWEIAGRE